MPVEQCIFCQSSLTTNLTSSDPLEQKYSAQCNQCGSYAISGLAFSQVEHKSDIRYKLSSVLCERKIKGLSCPMIVINKENRVNVVTIDELIDLFPKNASEMIERSLLNIAGLTKHPCDEVEFKGNEGIPTLFARNSDDMVRMSKLLENMDYVECLMTTDSLTFTITANGWEKVESLKEVNIDSRQAFVAMWFNDEMNSVWKEGLSKGIEDAGYLALRIDNKEHNEKICDEIIAEIRRSRFVVADFTKNRGGVYFEAGFALGLGIPVIWTVRQDFLKKEGVHFDTRQYNHIDYNTPHELRNRLSNRIRATIVTG